MIYMSSTYVWHFYDTPGTRIIIIKCVKLNSFYTSRIIIYNIYIYIYI
jgi:hypothetical protein